ncbi:TPA: tail fiber assembly protein [Enterobacter roggenkampii]|uniref:tail fiber assembly protein n=1 Tax=Enterobacter roggenkampii TaxID=1812935 RepID=UPI003C6ECCD8
MTYLFSAKFNAFYNAEDVLQKRDIYIANGTYPDDGKEVPDSVFSEFAGSPPPSGKVRTVNGKGMPEWMDQPSPTKDEYVKHAETVKIGLLREVNEKTLAWQSQLALGIITEDDKGALIAWMKYYQAVQSIDTSQAPEIKWPDKPVI